MNCGGAMQAGCHSSIIYIYMIMLYYIVLYYLNNYNILMNCIIFYHYIISYVNNLKDNKNVTYKIKLLLNLPLSNINFDVTTMQPR